MAFKYIKEKVLWFKAAYFAHSYEMAMNEYSHRPDNTNKLETKKSKQRFQEYLHKLEVSHDLDFDDTELYENCIYQYNRKDNPRPCTLLVNTYKDEVFRNLRTKT